MRRKTSGNKQPQPPCCDAERAGPKPERGLPTLEVPREPLWYPPAGAGTPQCSHVSISQTMPCILLCPEDCVVGAGRADPAVRPSSLLFIKGAEEEERRPGLTTFSSSAGKRTSNQWHYLLPGDALHRLGARAHHHLRRNGCLELIPRRPPGK